MITKRPESNNTWQNFWHYQIGIDVIPADTRNERPVVEWKKYQNVPVPEEQHHEWEQQDKFKDGMAIIAGKVLHNERRKICTFPGRP